MNGIIELIENTFAGRAWIVEVFLVVLFTVIIVYIENKIYQRLIPRLRKTFTIWDNTLIYAAHRPFQVLVWLLGLSFALDIVQRTLTEEYLIFQFIPTLRTVTIIAIITWFLIRFVKEGEQNFITHRKPGQPVDTTTVNAISNILRVTIIVTSGLVLLQTFNVNISGILALGGVGGIAISFAAKDLLANFFGSLMLYFDRPFAIGDWVRSPDREIEGTVERIGWRLTVIRTFDKRPLYVPNSAFATISIENPSRMHNRRIYTKVGVRYDDAIKVDGIIKDVKHMLQNHPDIDSYQTLIVNLVEFGPSSLNFMVYTFTKTTNWIKFQEVQQDVFLKVIEIVHKHGAQCAFPTTTLHVPEGIKVAEMSEKQLQAPQSEQQ